MPAVRSDVFPATVAVAPADFTGNLSSVSQTEGAVLVSPCRVVVSNDRIIIAQDSGSGPQIVFSEGIDSGSFTKSSDTRTQDHFVTTNSGKQIAFRKDSACGCGSRLRSWNPYKGMASSIKDPTE